MNFGIVKEILLFVLILLAQVLVLNHIHLFGCATSLLYIYMVMRFRRDYPRWAMLLSCFVMGLVLDIFANTPGMATVSLTFMGFIRPYLLMPFLTRDAADDMEPSIATLGMASYVYYTLITVFIYCLVFFTVEAFCFFNWPQWLACVLASTVLTTLLILVIENARKL